MRAEIAAEIQTAKAQGLPYTPFRPFLDQAESLGAMRCGAVKLKGKKTVTCNRPTTHVSYSTSIAGRTALCTECAARM